MKTILLSLLLMLSSSSHAYNYNLRVNDLSFREHAVEKLSDIYHRCITLAVNPETIKVAKRLVLERDKVIMTDKLAKKYAYTLCMTGNFDTEYNDMIKLISNMKKEI